MSTIRSRHALAVVLITSVAVAVTARPAHSVDTEDEVG